MDTAKKYLTDILKTIGIFVLATLTGMLFRRWGFTEPNIVVVYIFAVLMTARFTHGYLFGILSSVAALLGFNYFFTVPLHTLAVNDSSYFTTFAIMTITAVMTSTLTSKAKFLTREAREKEQERLRDQEMMVRERDRANLLRAISHDLRTPLSGIMGTSEMLMDMTEDADERYPMMQGIYKDADWLYSLVNNILSLTRLQDGNIVIHKEMEALEEVIESAMSRIARSRPERDIQVELPEDFHLVPMDAKLIEQVISNLLDNAVKHSPDDSSIAIVVGYRPDRAAISVKDEGEGIAECDLDHIFQMFYTSSTRTADARNGIGLGLAICETVVKAHGGEITAGNRKDRRGAEFTFWLPLPQEEAGLENRPNENTGNYNRRNEAG